MNTHEKTGNAGTFPVIFLIIKISARNTSVNKQSNYKYMNFWNIARPEESPVLKKMLEQPREMGEMTLKDFVPMSLRCQMRSNRKSGKCKEKQNIAGERFANHYPRRCKI